MSFLPNDRRPKWQVWQKIHPYANIESVALIGAGTMGGGIAMNFASKGIPVYMVDVDDAAIERGMAVVRSNYMRGVKKGRMSEAQFEDPDAACSYRPPTMQTWPVWTW